MESKKTIKPKVLKAIPVISVVVIFACMYGCPKYNVWQKGMEGEAELKQAEWNRQIAVKEAAAKLESSKSLAQAEIERAKGVAEANRIIGDSLRGNEGYLHYLWIHNLETTRNQIIYIPTEATLPILESNRFKKEIQQKQHERSQHNG